MKTKPNPITRIGSFTSKCFKSFMSGIGGEKFLMRPQARKFITTRKKPLLHEGERHYQPRIIRKAI